jgi:hypothetical protein
MKRKNFYWLLYNKGVYLIYLIDVIDGWLIGPWMEVRTIDETCINSKLIKKVHVDSKIEIFLKYQDCVKRLNGETSSTTNIIQEKRGYRFFNSGCTTKIVQKTSIHKLFKINSAIIS